MGVLSIRLCVLMWVCVCMCPLVVASVECRGQVVFCVFGGYSSCKVCLFALCLIWVGVICMIWFWGVGKRISLIFCGLATLVVFLGSPWFVSVGVCMVGGV